jgi:sucrose phosphorylase
MKTELQTALYDHISCLYGVGQADSIYRKIFYRLANFWETYPDLVKTTEENRLSQVDSILITYGDMVRSEDEPSLQTLAAFLEKHLGGTLSTVHLLPFFPYSSDDGFSVIDYYQVNPEFGDWEDISMLGVHFRLMFDAVVNHISAESSWFQRFFLGDPVYQDFFYVVEEDFDSSRLFRPRALPFLTSFSTQSGDKQVWTTFSADQIDLNYENPDVLIAVIDVLLYYVARGAEFIRLDAIAFIWKESGTNCIHLPQTHRIIQLMRTVLDLVAPQVSIITETNVPHEENISYFGDGTNEAQLVYNFTLPPLTLHAFHSGDASVLTKWAKTLSLPSKQTTFFNFLASHDGVGLMPVRGILEDAEIDRMVKRIETIGGYVSYKNNPDGSQMAYELNINYLDALGNPAKQESARVKSQRFLCSQAIMLALQGVPGIYFHSMFGSQNWQEGVEVTGRYRTINRQKLERGALERDLANPHSLRHRVFTGFRRMLEVRRSNPAFHPFGNQKIIAFNPAVFAILRTPKNGGEPVLCLHNVSDKPVDLKVKMTDLPFDGLKPLVDILVGDEIVNNPLFFEIQLAPYKVYWIQEEG